MPSNQGPQHQATSSSSADRQGAGIPAVQGAPAATETIQLDGVDLRSFLGPQDNLLKELERSYPRVSVHVRGHVLTLSGPTLLVAAATKVVRDLLALVQGGAQMTQSDVQQSSKLVNEGSERSAAETLNEVILSIRGKVIRPKTPGQRDYVDAIDNYTIVFGIGPAGTGKTYLAMAKAVQALQRQEVSKIILTRPAVEAGESLGYLPGTLEDKIDPYLRPLFDALSEMMDPETVPRLIESGTIEVAPLAYMRGRTLNDSFVVLDEAQNTTPEQMKMFLTRLGFGSRMVVTGDITQVDLPAAASGLRLVTKVLDDVEDIHFAQLTSEDVVRHTLVGRIIDAYTSYDEEQQARAFIENTATPARNQS